MSEATERFFQVMRTKRVAFIGIGVTNTDTIRLFLKKGIHVTILDRRVEEELGDDFENLTSCGATFILGENYLSGLSRFDVVFRTPGMYFLSEKLTEARENGVAIVSEMEVFFQLCPCKIYAVTGSDGKTTTSTIISEFFKNDGRRVHLGGNIGKALLPEIETISPEDICVVELSSFQLISMRQSPDVAVITNISPNHLDVHKNMQEYIDAKKNILLHQNGFSKSVLNLDNEETASLKPLVRGTCSFFSVKQVPKRGAFLDKDGYLCFSKAGKTNRICHKSELKIPGMHNVENYLTALAAVQGEVSESAVKETIASFTGVEHRIELVRILEGVRYYNDSIASSPTRTIAGLKSFEQKIILIAGGYDKNIPYAPLGPELCRHVKAVILLGMTGPKIEEAIRNCKEYQEGSIEIYHVRDLKEAVSQAREIAKEGDVVSLSPASASFDQYKNFEYRGRHFKSLVNDL